VLAHARALDAAELGVELLGARQHDGQRLLGAADRLEAFEEVGDVDLEQVRHLEETAGADAVLAALVFLDLLEADAERLTELGLAHSARLARHADTLGDMVVVSIGISCIEGRRRRARVGLHFTRILLL
jgi:hypothetical protein